MRLVLDHLWQSTLFAAAAAILAAGLRKHPARLRYVVWLAASIKFLVPFAALAALGAAIPWHGAARIASPSPAFLYAVDAVTVPFSQTVFDVPAQSARTVSGPLFDADLVRNAAVAVWLLGALLIAARWFVRWRRVTTLVHDASTDASDGDRSTRTRIRRACGGHRLDVALADTALEPGVVGVFKPVLLWPRGISERLSDEQIEAIVAHERCHVRWCDNAAAALHMCVEALFWFHPGVWLIGARLVDERERGCDEDVVRAGIDPQAYAEGILKVCEFHLASPLACVAGVTGSDLRRRIEHIMSARIGERLRAWKTWTLAAATLASIAAPVAAGAVRGTRAVQTTPGGQPADTHTGNTTPPSFDVVSIKPDRSGDDRIVMMAQPGGRIVATNVTLRLLIRNAYRVQDFQIVDAPSWLGTDRFDIEAKAAGGNPSQEQLQGMLQSLLADHFKLAVHRETREMPVYDLVAARADGRLGPQLRRSAIDCSNAPGRSPAAPPPSAVAPGSPQAQCGFKVGPGTITARGVPLAGLAASLSNSVSRIVLDRTALDGSFDVDLTWAPGGVDSTIQDRASIFTAIQEQLGLRLEATRGPVDVLVVDAAGRPSDTVLGSDTAPAPPAVQPGALFGVSSGAQAAKRIAFDVVSIKPTTWDESRLNQRPVLPGGRYAGLVSLQGILAAAYRPEGIQRIQQIVGYPTWAAVTQSGGYYDINAAVGPDGPKDVEGLTNALPALMKSLLEDRFQLVAHLEQRGEPIYAVTLARSDGRLGPALRKSTADCATRREHPTPDAPACGIRLTPVGATLVGVPANAFASLAQVLSGQVMHAPLGLPVVNRTNLDGNYDAEIDLSAEVAAASGATPNPAASFAAISAVWRDQLGLTIERREEPTNVLVIDHVEQPSAN